VQSFYQAPRWSNGARYWLEDTFFSDVHDFSHYHFLLVASGMSSNTNKDATENVTTALIGDKTASNESDKSWDESSNDRPNESDNEGTIVYEEVASLGDGFDRLR
jgi:hypothetical protein